MELHSDSLNNSLGSIGQNVFSVRNPHDALNILYSLDGLFSITYEECSGITVSDQINIVTISSNKYNSGTYPMEMYLTHAKERATHKHDYYELMLVLDGEILHRIEDKEYYYKAGCGCLVNRNIQHTETFIDAAKVLFVGISAQLASEMIEHYSSKTYWSGSVENTVLNFIKLDLVYSNTKEYLDFFPSFQNPNSIKELHDIADFLINTAMSPDFGAFYMICGTICKITQLLTDPNCYHVDQIKLNSRADFLLFQRINHLLEDTNGRISRSEIEGILNYSGNYINKIVKKYSGMNLFDYSMTFCMKRVEYLLVNTDQSISSIMLELDFKNPTHFYSIFKNKYGISPGEYRKACGR